MQGHVKSDFMQNVTPGIKVEPLKIAWNIAPKLLKASLEFIGPEEDTSIKTWTKTLEKLITSCSIEEEFNCWPSDQKGSKN